MTMIRKVVPAQFKTLGDDEVEVRMSTATLARDGHILIPQGARFENYRKNPVFLWNHDVDNPPVGRSEEITVDGEEIVSRVKFPPVGISSRADEIRGLTKAGFINGVSVGFDPLDGEPLDPKKPRGGMRFTDWDLIECSFCCVPVDTDALVTARAEKGAADWKCGASRELPVEDSDDWDGSAAEASVFEWAGGDDFDPSKARKGFLAYNASKPKERGSYKLPIAHVTDGRLKVPKGAIRAAASRLSQADIPDDTKTAAQAVIDHYEEKAGMGKKADDTDRAIVVKHKRSLERAPKVPIFKRGLYEVANLAGLLGSLGYCTSYSEWEEEMEEDDSKVPAMLGEALKQLGEALIAMTTEEVGELLAHHDDEGEEDEDGEGRAYITAGKTVRARAWRRAIVATRAGKALSASNSKKLEQAQDHRDRAMKHHKTLGEHHKAVGGHMDAITEQQSKASEAHGEMGEALHAAKSDPEKAAEHVARAIKQHKALGGHLEDIGDNATDMKDRHQDVGDSHEAMGRCMRSAQRCVRGVVEGATAGADDGDSKEVQTSSGTAESEGSANDRSLNLKRRQKDLSALADLARSYS